MEPMEKVRNIVRILDEKKGINLNAIRVTEITSVTDYMIMCTGGSSTQIKALSGFVQDKMTELGAPPHHVEGRDAGSWILLDFGDAVVHIFSKELREFYDLDHFWGDGEILDLSEMVIKPTE